ncbi:hypothetical protein EB19_02349 [Enterococcus faecium]|nr:hypothetical protein EB19_02349 [Enterococcus faecium]
MELGKSDYQLFDRPIYAFKQLKESHPTDKIEQIKKEQPNKNSFSYFSFGWAYYRRCKLLNTV